MNSRQKLVQQQFLNNEKAVIGRLKQVYGQALADCDREIEALMKRFDPETGDLPQSVVYQLQYQQMIRKQVEGILNQMQTKQFLTVSDYLSGCYDDGFIGTLFDLHGQGIPLTMPINQQALVRAVQLDSKISKGLYSRLGEDVDLLKKKITAQVSRSIATGTSFADTARQLAGYTRIGYNNAIRIARTEGHRIQTTAAMDVMEQAKAAGADVVKQWDSTLDGATRESHVFVDGEIREVDEAFSNGLMYPGDPSGPAAEVINCRCALLQRARWALKEKINPTTGEVTWEDDSFTKWNNFSGQLETFDSPESYGDFKKGFFSNENVRYMNYVEDMQRKYGTRDFRTVLDMMSDREYKHYSKLLNGNPLFNTKVPAKPVIPAFIPAKTVKEAEEFAQQWAKHVNYAGVTNLDAINEVNQTLQILHGQCPVDELASIATNGRLTRANAQANYHELDLGTKWLNRAGTEPPYDWAARVARNREKIDQYSKFIDPKKYPASTVKAHKKIIRELEEECKYARWSVSSTHGVKGVITHEYGHILADQYFGQINHHHANSHFAHVRDNPLWLQEQYVADVFALAKKNGDIHSISMYAATDAHEFFAETFTMHMMGEPLPDYIADMVKKVISDGLL